MTALPRLTYSCGLALLLMGSTAAADILSVTITAIDSDAQSVTAVDAETNRETQYTLDTDVRVRIAGDVSDVSEIVAPVRARIVTGRGNRIRSILIDADAASSTPDTAPVAASPSRENSSTDLSADWNQFRGPRRDNLSSEAGLMNSWPAGGPPLVLNVRGLGEGYSTVAAVGDLICTMGNMNGGEHIIALDRMTGRIVWTTRNGNEYREGQGNGPRGTPTIVNGRVYALGAGGDLTCCDLQSGTVHWQRNILRDFGGSNIVWGISESVLVDDGLVICTPGGNSATVAALNAETGTNEWLSVIPGQPKASYASPVAVTVDGVRQYVVFTSDGIAGVRADDGQPMWGQNASSNSTANCATPLIIGDRVFSSSDYGTGAELVELRSQGNYTRSRLVYHTRDMKNHHGGMVYVDGYIYGSNSDIFACIDVNTGNPTWRERGMKGSPVYADGKIVFRNERGEVVLMSANPQRFESLGRFDQPERSRRPAWSHPVIADGRLYLRDQDTLLVYALK